MAGISEWISTSGSGERNGFDGLTALQQEIFANAEETRALLG